MKMFQIYSFCIFNRKMLEHNADVSTKEAIVEEGAKVFTQKLSKEVEIKGLLCYSMLFRTIIFVAY